MEFDKYLSLSHPLIVVISGLTCSGKDSVIRRMEERGVPFHFVVTATSRPARKGEVDGKDYLFYSEEKFRDLIARNELLEHAVVYGQYKGIPKAQIRDAMSSGKDVIIRVDVQGAASIRESCSQAVFIFLLPGSESELIRRLSARGADSSEQTQIRLATARQEFIRIPDFDYVVVNPDGRLDDAVDSILAIMRAEHARTNPRAAEL